MKTSARIKASSLGIRFCLKTLSILSIFKKVHVLKYTLRFWRFLPAVHTETQTVNIPEFSSIFDEKIRNYCYPTPWRNGIQKLPFSSIHTSTN